jgi:hypothetical protein
VEKSQEDSAWLSELVVVVTAGFIAAIHVLGSTAKKDVDARDEPGHDG